jgi:hypothetical protein
MSNLEYTCAYTDFESPGHYYKVAAECSVLIERVVDGARGVMNEYSAISEYVELANEEGDQCFATFPAALEYFLGVDNASALIKQIEEIAIDNVA